VIENTCVFNATNCFSFTKANVLAGGIVKQLVNIEDPDDKQVAIRAAAKLYGMMQRKTIKVLFILAAMD
jgi:hypothetical protein